jgi:hypothetical protein
MMRKYLLKPHSPSRHRLIENGMTEVLDGGYESFERYGYFVIKGAFGKETAAQCRDVLWECLTSEGISRDDLGTWPLKIKLDKTWKGSDGSPWDRVFTQTLESTIQSLLGESNKIGAYGAGWWMVTFPGCV